MAPLTFRNYDAEDTEKTEVNRHVALRRPADESTGAARPKIDLAYRDRIPLVAETAGNVRILSPPAPAIRERIRHPPQGSA